MITILIILAQSLTDVYWVMLKILCLRNDKLMKMVAVDGVEPPTLRI